MRNGIIVAVYLVVLAINLIVAIKFPDSTIMMHHLLASLVFLAILVYLSIKISIQMKYFYYLVLSVVCIHLL